jgi:hypothetical protein
LDSAPVTKKRKHFDILEFYETAQAKVQKTSRDKDRLKLKLDYLNDLRQSSIGNLTREERIANDPELKRQEQERNVLQQQKQVEHNIRMRSDPEYRKQCEQRHKLKKKQKLEQRRRRKEQLKADPRLRQKEEEMKKRRAVKSQVRKFLDKERLKTDPDYQKILEEKQRKNRRRKKTTTSKRKTVSRPKTKSGSNPPRPKNKQKLTN